MITKITRNVGYRPLIALFLTISIAVPLLHPLGTPVIIGDMTKILYKAVNDAPPGSVIFVPNTIDPATYTEIGFGAEALFSHILSRDLKIVTASFGQWGAAGPILYQKIISGATIPADKKYGVDYVNLGYAPGDFDTLYATFFKNTHLFGTDFYKTPIEQLPIMQSVKTANDISFVVDFTAGADEVLALVRQWVSTYNKPLYVFPNAGNAAPIVPFYPKQINAILVGVRGSAEYERITNRLGPASAVLDAASSSIILVICLILFINVRYFRASLLPNKKESHVEVK